MSGFHNYIFTKLGTLVLKALQSPNYIAGTSGWTVKKDGSAEFNNLAIRGTFNGTNFIINSTGAFFYSGTPATGNLIVSVTNVSGTDAFGNAFQQGTTSYGTLPGPFVQMFGATFTLSSNAAATTITHSGQVNLTDSVAAGQAPAINIISPNTALISSAGRGEIVVRGQSHDASVAAAVISDQILTWIPGGTHTTVEVWNAMSVINGWSNTGGSDVTAQYRMVASPPNSVEIIGCIHETAKTSNVFATLPSGYQPVKIQGFGAHISVATGGTAVATTAGIQCDTSGNLSLLGYASGTSAITAFFHGFISLDA